MGKVFEFPYRDGKTPDEYKYLYALHESLSNAIKGLSGTYAAEILDLNKWMTEIEDLIIRVGLHRPDDFRTED